MDSTCAVVHVMEFMDDTHASPQAFLVSSVGQVCRVNQQRSITVLPGSRPLMSEEPAPSCPESAHTE